MSLDIRRIGHEKEDALVPRFSERMHVDVLSKERRGIHLEIPGVNHLPDRRTLARNIDDHGRGIDDAVIHRYGLHFEIAELDPIAHFERAKIDLALKTMLLQTLTNEQRGEVGGINRRSNPS